ncbi:MAG: hypothetical protein JWM76_4498 [Pseudonocardiales bacterium]|nr:hypothetical protein [Pseudonocardiales bacterium]
MRELLAGGLASGQRIELTSGSAPVAVVVSTDELAAMENTQQLLATNGALAAVAEGLADLAAGRADNWTQLRTDYGRGDPDNVTDPSSPATVSHRARWDLELLPPPVAQHCFDLLDGLVGGDSLALGRPLTAGFPELNLAVSDGYRMVLRPVAHAVEVVHIDTAP